MKTVQWFDVFDLGQLVVIVREYVFYVFFFKIKNAFLKFFFEITCQKNIENVSLHCAL